MNATALILALALASPAGDECHNSGVEPDSITNWTITGGHGSIVIDATLVGGNPAQYYGRDGDCCLSWNMYLSTSGAYMVDLSAATVTDSTFHAEVPHEPGTFSFFACVKGHNGDTQLCPCAYELEGTITVLPAKKTPARRVSWGELRKRWAR